MQSRVTIEDRYARGEPTPARMRGSHGRLPDSPDDGPVLLCSELGAAKDTIAATEVKDLLLRLADLIK